MIYFIQSGEGGPIKVGYVEGLTRSAIEFRVGLLQVGNPEPLKVLATMAGGRAEERELHKRFRAGHIRGEWFNADTPFLQDAIDAAPNDEAEIAWQLREDGEQICEWCRTEPVAPPRRSLCSERCATDKRRAAAKAKGAA